MTVETTDSTEIFTGDGIQTVFNFDFPVAKETDIICEVKDNLGNAPVIVTDFSVNIADPSSVTYPVQGTTPLPVGYKLIVRRDTERTQELNLQEQGRSPLESIESALDKITLMIQDSYNELAIIKEKLEEQEVIGVLPLAIQNGGTGGTTQQSAVNALGLGNVQGDIDTLETSVTGLQTNVSTLQTNVTTLTTNRVGTILPVNSSFIPTNQVADLGTTSNNFRDIYCRQVIQTNPIEIQTVAIINFQGNLASLTGITFTFSGTTITATVNNSLKAGDSITFINQTGNNSVLNGTWEITTATSTNFTFAVNSTPAGALSSATGEPVVTHYKKGSILIGRQTTGVYRIVHNFTPDRTNYIIDTKTYNTNAGAQIGYLSSLELINESPYLASNSLIFMAYGSQQSTGVAYYNVINAMVALRRAI